MTIRIRFLEQVDVFANYHLEVLKDLFLKMKKENLPEDLGLREKL